MKKVLVFLILVIATLTCFVSCVQGQTQNPIPHAHTFGEWSTTQNATCIDNGVKTRYCSCGEKQSDTIPAIGHNYVDGTCTNCGDVKQSPECKHENLDVLKAQNPTCTKTGLTEGIICLDCEQIIVAQTEISKTDHTYDDDYDTTCNNCSFTRSVDCKHENLCDIAAKEPTCTETGLTLGKYCAAEDCQKIIVMQEVIPALGHQFGSDEICDNCEAIQFPGLYDSNDTLLASWNELVNTYGMDITVNYTMTSCKVLKSSPYCVIQNENLTLGSKLVIDNSVTTIGNFAFYACNDLTSIVISNSVTTIGNRSFEECRNLQYINIPDSVTTIGSRAFNHCTSLTNVELPASLAMIGSEAFAYCDSLVNITVAENNAIYKSIDGNLYNKDATTLIQYTIGKTITSFTIPESVTTIDRYAFANCDSLENIAFNDNAKAICRSAFSGCHYLASVEIPASVTTIDDYAFHSCYSLKNVSFAENSQLETLGENAFYDCTSLESIVIPVGISLIDWYTLGECNSLQCITFTGTKAQWGAINKYTGWNSRTGNYKIYCTDGVIEKDGTIYTLNEDGKSYSVAGIDSCLAKNVVILSTYNGLPVTSISSMAFYNCTSLESIKIPNSITSINYQAFSQCTSLKSIEIPNSITSINYATFHTCTSLESATFEEGCQLESIGNSAFYNCTSLKSIKIPEGVTDIGSDAFYNCTALEDINIPESVVSLRDAFTNCTSLIYTQYDNAYYLGNENNPYYALIKATNIDIASCNIHEDTYIIAGGAFEDCTSLTGIIIPDTITTINSSTFENCTSLASIEIPASVKSIGSYAFQDCYTLKSVTFAEGSRLEFIDVYSFKSCKALTNITIPANVKTIGEQAFCNCTSLKSVTFAEGSQLEIIGESAFYKCALTSIEIPASVKTIGVDAFHNCTSLKSVTFAEGSQLESIRYGAFRGCSTLSTITYHGTIAQWKTITKGDYWNQNVPATYVQCDDGEW